MTKEGGLLPKVSGTGSYISLTGRFEGIQGDITFTGEYLTPYDTEKGTLGDLVVDITFNYTLP